MKKRQQFAANSINLLIRHIVLQANKNTASINNLLHVTNTRKMESDIRALRLAKASVIIYTVVL